MTLDKYTKWSPHSGRWKIDPKDPQTQPLDGWDGDDEDSFDEDDIYKNEAWMYEYL